MTDQMQWKNVDEIGSEAELLVSATQHVLSKNLSEK
jgi:hypothetical protein